MTLFIDCASCRGERVRHYVDWEGQIVTEFCNDCYGSGAQEFTCHDGCPSYDHLHEQDGEISYSFEQVPVDHYEPEWLVGSESECNHEFSADDLERAACHGGSVACRCGERMRHYSAFRLSLPTIPCHHHDHLWIP